MQRIDSACSACTGRDRGRRGTSHRAVLLALAILLGGCGGQEADPAAAETALSREAFIDVIVALRNVEMDLERDLEEDSVIAARFEVLRDSVLEAHAVTGEELRAFLGRHSDVEYQDALWDTIAERLKRPRQFETDRSVIPEPRSRGLRPDRPGGLPGDRPGERPDEPPGGDDLRREPIRH